jgi:hypothetical protein
MSIVSRFRRKPNLYLPFWRTDGRTFYAEPADLQDAIEASGQTPDEITSRLGPGRVYLQSLLQGGKISLQAALLVEWGLTPRELRLRSVI